MTRRSVDDNDDGDDNGFDDALLGNGTSEESLLLQDTDAHAEGYTDSARGDISDSDPEKERARLRPRVVVLALVSIFLAEVAVNVAVPAMNAVMESIICDQLHPGVAVGIGLEVPSDSVCKSADVQSYLVMMRGWMQTFESVPTILCSIPYGIMADRWGRKPVLGLSALGMNLFLVFTYGGFLASNIVPLWTILLANMFMFIGGGGMVATAMLYTMLSDVVSVDNRATVFFQFGAAFLTAQTISTPLSGFLMLYSIWLPLGLSWVLMTITNLLVLLFPETVQLHSEARDIQRRSNGHLPSSGDDSTVSAFHEFETKAKEGLMDGWQFLLDNTKIAGLMLSLVFVVLGKLANELLLQYATKRYHWTWSEAAFLMTISGVTSMITLIALLPSASWYLASYLGLSGVTKDLWLIRIVGSCLILGCLVIAVAPTGLVLAFGLIPYALGSGLSPLIRSVLSALVEEHHIAILNTLIGITESLGVMVASPLLAMSLSLGLKLGGGWIGLPFFFAAIFATIVTIVGWTFRPPRNAASGRLSTEP